MKFVRSKDFLAGTFFMLAGIAFILMARWYSYGTIQRIGPATFPTLVGACLALLGAIVALKALATHGEEVPRTDWRPLLIVLGVVLLFGLLIEPVGLVGTTALVVALASPAARTLTLPQTIAIAAFISLLSAVIFVVLLGLQINLWPVFYR